VPNRILKDTINESRGLSDCSFFAQDLYKRLITYADDYGRFNADPMIMLARLYPRELDVVTNEDLMDGLTDLAGMNKIAFYMGASIHDRKLYGCFPNWAEHQRIRESKKKCPDPSNTEVNDWYLRRFVPMSMKIELLERDNCTCAECGKRIAETRDAKTLIKMGAGLFHIDHIVPVNQGGRATMENLRILCPKCNLSRKRYLSFDEILQFAENCGESRRISASRGELPLNPIQSNIESESESEAESECMIGDSVAAAIQSDHNRVMDAAEDAGFVMSNSVRAALIRLYAENGLQKVLDGIASCVKHGAPNLAYLEGCMNDKPKPKKEKPKVIAQDFEQRDYTDVQKQLEDETAQHVIQMLKDSGEWDYEHNCSKGTWRGA
jgi:5-methylcytosine-specific restriction endonuclease McrA